jgi:quinol monooxygenase YgiN
VFTRFVKMEFAEENISSFLDNFETMKEKIRNFPGCLSLKLYQDKNGEAIFFTYSKWEDEINLKNYRNSQFFEEVWATTKAMFRSKSQAWSVDTIHQLE